MATINYVKEIIRENNDRVIVVSWDALANGDVGQPFNLAQMADRTVQVVGVFGGGNAAIQGSIDGVNYHTLTDPQGNALSFNAAGIEAITELVRYIRPLVTGSGTTSLTIYIIARVTS